MSPLLLPLHVSILVTETQCISCWLTEDDPGQRQERPQHKVKTSEDVSRRRCGEEVRVDGWGRHVHVQCVRNSPVGRGGGGGKGGGIATSEHTSLLSDFPSIILDIKSINHFTPHHD